MTKHRNQAFIESFGNRVKEMRKEKGLTQETLAIACGIELRQIGRIERGKVNTTINTAYLIAEALGVEVKEMFSR